MKRACIAALLLLAGGCDQPEGEPVTRTEIGKGAEEMAAARKASSDCQPVTFDGAKFTDCVADPAKHRITTALGPKDGKPYRSLGALAGSRGADAAPVAFAVNGGMFDEDGKPIGYYVEKGERLQELNRADGPGNFHMKPNGVFYGTNGEWRIRTADDFYANVGDRPAFGTQSGPMLVIAGKLHPEITEDGPSRTIRNGVGIDPQGRAHFVISNEAVSFGKIARYYRDEVKAKDALYLDGAVSALWDPIGDRLDLGAPLGPLIVVEKRASAAQ